MNGVLIIMSMVAYCAAIAVAVWPPYRFDLAAFLMAISISLELSGFRDLEKKK